MSKKANKRNIDFPQKIHKLAEKFRKTRLEEERKARQKKSKEERERKRMQAKRLKSGLPYAEKIFVWAGLFRKSSIGRELMEVSHIPTAFSNIFFFNKKVGELKWVGFVVSPRGLRLNSGGRYNTLTEKQVKSASHLAKSVDTRILQVVCEWIDSGKVWKCIERGFDYLKER